MGRERDCVRLEQMKGASVQYEALSYKCTRPYATSVRGLKLLEYEALSS